MTIPSPHISGEFIPVETDPRALALQAALGVSRYHGRPHFTPARASKYNALLDAGFEAVNDGRHWRFRRGAGKLLPLHHAMLCIEVMAPLAQARAV